MTIVIARDGTIREARVISGNPIFYKAALDAVKQWRYEPVLIGGEAIEVETEVTVLFDPE